MPKVNHGPGTQRPTYDFEGAQRNPPPPPQPPSGGTAEEPKKPSLAWRAFKFVAIAAIGGIVTTVAVDKFKEWWGPKRNEEEDEDGLERNQPAMASPFGMPGVMPLPIPWPTPTYGASYAPPPPPAPEPQARSRPRRNSVEDLSPEEIYEEELTKLQRSKARKKAHEDFDQMQELDDLEEMLSKFERGELYTELDS